MTVSIQEIERMIPYYSQQARDARQLLVKARDEQERCELRCVVESWESIVQHAKAEIASR